MVAHGKRRELGCERKAKVGGRVRNMKNRIIVDKCTIYTISNLLG